MLCRPPQVLPTRRASPVACYVRLIQAAIPPPICCALRLRLTNAHERGRLRMRRKPSESVRRAFLDREPAQLIRGYPAAWETPDAKRDQASPASAAYPKLAAPPLNPASPAPRRRAATT